MREPVARGRIIAAVASSPKMLSLSEIKKLCKDDKTASKPSTAAFRLVEKGVLGRVLSVNTKSGKMESRYFILDDYLPEYSAKQIENIQRQQQEAIAACNDEMDALNKKLESLHQSYDIVCNFLNARKKKPVSADDTRD